MLQGFFYAIVAACTFGLIPLFTVPLMQSGLEATSILFFRFGFSGLIIMIIAFISGHTLRVSLKDFGKFLIIGFCYALSAVTFFWAFNYMDTGIVATVQYCYPIFVVWAMVAFFGERFHLSTLIAAIFICIGVAVFSLQDTAEVEVNFIGMALTIFSATQMALYVIGIQVFNFETKDSMTTSMYIMICGATFAGIFAIYEGSITLPTQASQWTDLALLTCITGVISTSALVRAVKYVGPSLASILGGIEPVTAMLVGMWAFNETLTTGNIIGSLCIIGAVTFVAVHTHLKQSKNTITP